MQTITTSKGKTSQSTVIPLSGFGLLKSKKAPVSADFDPAFIFKKLATDESCFSVPLTTNPLRSYLVSRRLGRNNRF